MKLRQLEKQMASFASLGGKRVSAIENSVCDDIPFRFSAKWLRAQRQRTGLSAANYGRLIGVSGTTILNWEHGCSRPRRGQLAALAKASDLRELEAEDQLTLVNEMQGRISRMRIKGIPCSLTTKRAQTALRAVLKQIGQRSPKNLRTLQILVRDVKPWDGPNDGTMGEWKAFHAIKADPRTWDYGFGLTPGVLFVLEAQSPAKLRATFAHELGHAISTEDDRRKRDVPSDEWASEMTADRFAFKWGFGTLLKRFRDEMDTSHHGGWPGEVVSIYGGTFRVDTNFNCHRID